MKNRNVLTNAERKIVDSFLAMKYPPIYKTDKTDRILFVELVDFDVCPFLLGKIRISSEQFCYILQEYDKYLAQTDEALFDKYAAEHYKLIVQLISLFKKYYSMSRDRG